MRHSLYILILMTILTGCNGQAPLPEYLGGWSGELAATDAFVFAVQLNKTPQGEYNVTFKGKQKALTLRLEKAADGNLIARYADQLTFRLDLDNVQPTAFIETGNHLTYLDLQPKSKNSWSASWNLFTSKKFDPTFYLSLDRQDDNTFYASTFLQSPVMHYMQGEDFEVSRDKFQFRDTRSGINFTGRLKKDRIDLSMAFLLERLHFSLYPTDYSKWAIGQPDPGSKTPHLALVQDSRLKRMTEDILSDTLEQTHAVLIRQGDSTLYEQYFDGFDQYTPHDTRSAAKSFASAIIGIAMAEGSLKDEFQLIKPFYEESYPHLDWSAGKADINLHHLMTMSSGLDAIDFGLNRMSFANEGAYQNQDDWAGYILSAPMINTPGEHANYGSGSPHLLGEVLLKATEKQLLFYLHQQLLGPLGFKHYRLQIDDKGAPYFGGGWYLTARDLASFGELYLEKGVRDGEQILAKEWVHKSMQQHLILENTIDQNPYGYFFWHKTYQVGSRSIASVEARGSGGQYLFIVPEYDLVVVILSGNYQNNKFAQPERIMQEYILPEIE